MLLTTCYLQHSYLHKSFKIEMVQKNKIRTYHTYFKRHEFRVANLTWAWRERQISLSRTRHRAVTVKISSPDHRQR